MKNEHEGESVEMDGLEGRQSGDEGDGGMDCDAAKMMGRDRASTSRAEEDCDDQTIRSSHSASS